MKKLLALLLIFASTAQAQDFRHRYFHYNQVFDATAPFTISANTADGADNNRICIEAGGDNACANGSRGAFLYMGGEQDGTLGGSWRLSTGTSGTDKSGNLYGDTFTFNSAAGANRWTFTADLTQNATNGGNIVFQKDGTGVVDSTDAPAAAGADLAGATLMTANVVFVTGADGSKGIKLYAAPLGGARYTIYNTANAVLKVYPGEAGDQINALGAGNPVGLAAYASLDCHASSASQVWCGVRANVSAP